ncbi:MAG: glycosyltransferase [Thermoleophilaceae bacterium]
MLGYFGGFLQIALLVLAAMRGALSRTVAGATVAGIFVMVAGRPPDAAADRVRTQRRGVWRARSASRPALHTRTSLMRRAPAALTRRMTSRTTLRLGRMQPSPRHLPRLAAVAVTFNSSKEIEAWVASFERSGMRDAIELCVVDSGSRTEEREACSSTRIGPRVDTLLLRPNYGYGRSCNAGAAATRAGTLLFLNPDAELCSLPPRFDREGLPDGLLLGAVKLLPGGGSRPLGFAHLPPRRLAGGEPPAGALLACVPLHGRRPRAGCRARRCW